MIMSLVFYMIAFIFGLLGGILPNGGGLPSGVYSAITYLSVQAHSWDYFVPVGTFFEVLLLVFSVESGILIFKIFRVVFKKLIG